MKRKAGIWVKGKSSFIKQRKQKNYENTTTTILKYILIRPKKLYLKTLSLSYSMTCFSSSPNMVSRPPFRVSILSNHLVGAEPREGHYNIFCYLYVK